MAEDKIYLTTDKNPNGPGLLAVMTLGHPQRGDADWTILLIEVVPDLDAAEEWFEEMYIEMPWERRH